MIPEPHRHARKRDRVLSTREARTDVETHTRVLVLDSPRIPAPRSAS
jgi:hypothetical protein